MSQPRCPQEVLETYPLTMVGVDFNEKSRIATACNLDQHQVPNRVISGDIGKPSALLAQLKRKKVNPKKALHVRSWDLNFKNQRF